MDTQIAASEQVAVAAVVAVVVVVVVVGVAIAVAVAVEVAAAVVVMVAPSEEENRTDEQQEDPRALEQEALEIFLPLETLDLVGYAQVQATEAASGKARQVVKPVCLIGTSDSSFATFDS